MGMPNRSRTTLAYSVRLSRWRSAGCQVGMRPADPTPTRATWRRCRRRLSGLAARRRHRAAPQLYDDFFQVCGRGVEDPSASAFSNERSRSRVRYDATRCVVTGARASVVRPSLAAVV
jgi:hypothetical protein